MDEWIYKMQYIHMMEYYPSVERNEVLMHATPWTNLESIILMWKEPGPKSHVSYDSTDMKCSEKANP